MAPDTLHDLRDVFHGDQRQALQRDKIVDAEADADVVAAYYLRLKAKGICVAHAMELTDTYQQMRGGWGE